MIRLVAYGTIRGVQRKVVGSDRQMASFALDCDGTTLRCIAWGTLAEQVPNEGTSVIIAGRMATRTWVDQQGQDRSITEVTVQDLDVITQIPF